MCLVMNMKSSQSGADEHLFISDYQYRKPFAIETLLENPKLLNPRNSDLLILVESIQFRNLSSTLTKR